MKINISEYTLDYTVLCMSTSFCNTADVTIIIILQYSNLTMRYSFEDLPKQLDSVLSILRQSQRHLISGALELFHATVRLDW